MTIRRSAAAVGAVTLGLLALTSCTKPTPLATVTVGGNSVSSEASCYNDGKPISDIKSCLSKAPEKTITVHPTDQVRIGVDPAIADKGWLIVTNGSPRTQPMKETYRSFSGSAFFTDSSTGASVKSIVLNIVESGDSSSGAAGVWTFKLVQADQ